MNFTEIKELFDRYVIPNYGRYPIAVERGQGSRVWDAEGREFLDLFPGWGVGALGHCHPRVSAAIAEQVKKLIHVPNTFYMEPQGRLAKYISENSFGGQCFFCNSGAEANEAAIKLARLHTPEGRFKIITMRNSFHGRTLATITATAQEKYQKGFEPLPQGFTYVPFNDVDAVKKAIDDQTCAILVEPIQGEGGINIPSDDYLPRLREICDANGLLLIVDEVQTGMGRTGRYFAYQHFGITPDIMTLAKALGGGTAIGCMVAKPDIARSLVPGTHASTFGGNPVACAGGIAAFEAIEEENLLERAREIGAYAMDQLRKLQGECDLIREVRGMGLMIGVELTIKGADIVQKCMDKGVLLNCTHDTVIRFMPAMTVTKEEIDQGVRALKEALAEATA